jgi:phage minor structural protein
MIYIFNQNELFEALLSNENKDTCPFWDAVLEEKLGGEFHFTFTVPSFHPVAKRLQEKWYVATKDPDGTFQLFIIQEIEDTHSEQATKTIFCEHAIVELLDEIIEEQLLKDRLSSQAVTTVLTGTRWTLGTVSEASNRHDYTVRFKTVLEALDKIFERWGREVRYRVEIADNRIQGRFIDLFIKRGTNTGKRFDFEQDLTEIVRTVDAREIKTALWGRGARIQPEAEATGEETFEIGGFSEEETNRVDFKPVVWGQDKEFTKPAGQGWVGSEQARERWGRVTAGGKRHLFGVVTFNDISNPEELLQATADTLKQASEPRVTYQASAVDLFNLTGQRFHEIRMGDTVKVIDNDLNIRLEARVIARKMDLNFPELIEWTFGNYRPVFTDSVDRVKSEISRQLGEINLGGDFISRGEQIKTEWLEGTIDTLRNSVISGGGTVTMTEGDGLMITDKPLDQNPTKAPSSSWWRPCYCKQQNSRVRPVELANLWDWRRLHS